MLNSDRQYVIKTYGKNAIDMYDRFQEIMDPKTATQLFHTFIRNKIYSLDALREKAESDIIYFQYVNSEIIRNLKINNLLSEKNKEV